MARKRFQDLDEEQRALHESWDDIARVVLLVILTSTAIWALLVAMVGVPLAAIALVLEVFGAPYGPPAILACCVTYVLTLRLSVYEGQAMSPDPDADETGRRV